MLELVIDRAEELEEAPDSYIEVYIDSQHYESTGVVRKNSFPVYGSNFKM